MLKELYVEFNNLSGQLPVNFGDLLPNISIPTPQQQQSHCKHSNFCLKCYQTVSSIDGKQLACWIYTSNLGEID